MDGKLQAETERPDDWSQLSSLKGRSMTAQLLTLILFCLNSRGIHLGQRQQRDVGLVSPNKACLSSTPWRFISWSDARWCYSLAQQ